MANLCSTASVRAVLGVSEKEIRDAVLLNPIYAVRLDEEMLELNDNILVDFGVAEAADPKSGAQARFYDLAQTYSAYKMASFLLGSVSMFAPQTVKDDRTEMSRVADPYKQLRGDVDASLAIIKRQLLKAYAVINPDAPAPTAVIRTMIAAIPLGTNPVTG